MFRKVSQGFEIIFYLCDGKHQNWLEMTIEILHTTDNTSVGQIDALLHKLSPTASCVDAGRLKQLIEDADFTLFVARDDNGAIRGMLTLTACQTLTYSKYWIEDVIVDECFRGQGAGRALVRAAVDFVKDHQTHPVIYLTSNPSRVSARTLYQSEGFEQYETGVFRIRQDY